MPDQRTYCPHGVNSYSPCAQCVVEGVRSTPAAPAIPALATQVADAVRGINWAQGSIYTSYLAPLVRMPARQTAIRYSWGSRPVTPSPATRSADMPTPLNYPESRDPNIPGDGRPLQVGDIVTHQAAETNYRAEVLTVRPHPPGRQVVSLRPILNPGERDRYHIQEAGEGAWEDVQLVLLQRPSVTTPQPPPALPASLDPAVPGDGRPLLRGDIVRFRGDQDNGSRDVQVLSSRATTAGTVPLLSLGIYGSNSGYVTARRGWSSKDFLLVHRPTASESYMMPAASVEMGIDGAYVDEDFIQGVLDWLARVSADEVKTAECWPKGGYGNSPISWADACYVIQHWCSGKVTAANSAPLVVVRELMNYSYPLSERDSREYNANRLRRAITQLLNSWDTSVRRCVPCACEGIARPHESPECSHFLCTLCGLDKPGERCTVCEGLHTPEMGYNPEVTKICKSCCTHAECKEEGFEEIMLKSQQCVICKRGPKGCKCPGCEVKGCRVKRVRACCGGCESHCNCASMCMRHTGMRKLVKFPAPAGEKGMTRLLGTEIETYGSAINKYTPALRKAVEVWQASVITDGSIGGKGVELVTQPAGGSQWRQMITDLGAGFEESQSVTRETCGLHMHADCTDVDAHALKRIIQLYAHIEWCLYDAITHKRQTGNYSAPNGQKLLKWLDNDCAKFDNKMEAGEAKKRLAYIQYGMATQGTLPKLGQPWKNSYGETVIATKSTIESITSRWDETVEMKVRGKGDPNRYSGLNMHSYWLRGTLEFRHHHGTNDPVKITNWGFVIGSIVDWCVKHPDEDMPMILGLEPRLAMEMILEGQDDVMIWLKSRWDLFTTAHKTRKPEPTPDEMGEV